MGQDVRFSGRRITLRYEIAAPEAEARRRAEALCFDQTVELPAANVPPGPIRDEIVGRLEEFVVRRPSRSEAAISFPEELLGSELAQLLHLAYGIASLTGGVRVAQIHLPDETLARWAGPRYGAAGIRRLVRVTGRPLVCGVLKPLGLPASELARLARELTLGGFDLIKDDQGLGDHAFCPFEERVARCAEAIAEANRETGRRTLYLPHVTGTGEELRRRGLRARQLGADGLLVCPGLTGYDSLRLLAEDDAIGGVLVSHPALLGAYVTHDADGIAPPMLFGLLPRLAGADVTIYPAPGGGFSLTEADCRAIAAEARRPRGHLAALFPTAAGRMEADRIRAACTFYGGEVVIVVGGGVLGGGDAARRSCAAIMEAVGRWTAG